MSIFEKMKQEKEKKKHYYKEGLRLYQKENYKSAKYYFNELCYSCKNGKKYKDAYAYLKQCEKALAAQEDEKRKRELDGIYDLFRAGRYDKAYARIIDYGCLVNPKPEIQKLYDDCREGLYTSAVQAMENGDYKTAEDRFCRIKGYKDSTARYEICRKHSIEICYQNAVKCYENKDYDQAISWLSNVPEDYQDHNQYYDACAYEIAVGYMRSDNYPNAIKWLRRISGNYKDSSALLHKLINLEHSAKANIAFETWDELKH